MVGFAGHFESLFQSETNESFTQAVSLDKRMRDQKAIQPEKGKVAYLSHEEYISEVRDTYSY
jgi:hypothetical protein